MKKLELKDFKAYINLEIDFKSKTTTNGNFLLYGENGSGKSSIYEAIKIIFFKNKLSRNVPTAPTPEEQEENKRNFWSKYNNKKAQSDFSIKVNGEDYKDFDSEDYQVFMITGDKFCIDGQIQLDKLLEEFYFDITDINQFCIDNYENIQTNINENLKKFKEENIKIVIDNEDGFTIQIKDIVRNLETKKEVSKYFNEAKINLIILLLLFESIKKLSNQDKKKILVLDDFITSLDMANRTFLMKYIFDDFNDFQKIILTHNVYFYNLIMYFVNGIYDEKNVWVYANLYEINMKHKLFINDSVHDVKSIKKLFHDHAENIEDIGNKIRQKFEVLLYEFSKLLMVGAVETSNNILDNIVDGKAIYLKDGKKIASDLIHEIEEILNHKSNSQVKRDLLGIINEYKKDNLNNLQYIIRELKLYRKVTMHPMSHGSIGQTAFTTSEIEKSLEYLNEFEKTIKGLQNSSLDGA